MSMCAIHSLSSKTRVPSFTLQLQEAVTGLLVQYCAKAGVFHVLLILFLFAPLASLGQTGTDFWFVAPEVTDGYSDRPINLVFSTLDQASNITVEQPANPGFTTKNISLAANSSSVLVLTSDISSIENTPHDQVLNYGIHITSTQDISVYYHVETSGTNPEMYVLKGANALGTDFYIPAQNFWNNWNNYNPKPYSSFEIVATEDTTVVSITPSNDIVGHSANTTFTVNLDKGQTYSARASGNQAADHLWGSRVTSTKPIAITVSDDAAHAQYYGGCKDLMGDQIIPVELISDRYIAVKGDMNKQDKVFLIGVQDSTDIYIDGSGTPSGSINEGGIFELDLTLDFALIDLSKPCYALHITGSSCEVGAAVLPGLECTGSSQVGFTRVESGPFIVFILVRSGAEGDFQLNGDGTVITAADFAVVPGTNGDWMGASINLTPDVPVGSASLIKNTSDVFHLGIINRGNKPGAMYGYFSDYAKIRTNIIYHY